MHTLMDLPRPLYAYIYIVPGKHEKMTENHLPQLSFKEFDGNVDEDVSQQKRLHKLHSNEHPSSS